MKQRFAGVLVLVRQLVRQQDGTAAPKQPDLFEDGGQASSDRARLPAVRAYVAVYFRNSSRDQVPPDGLPERSIWKMFVPQEWNVPDSGRIRFGE